MTSVAGCGSSRLASGDVAEEETFTPHRNVRVPPERWDPFGVTVGKRARSAWLNDFMDWVNLDPQLWLDVRAIAAERGESLGAIVVGALRRYRTRHRAQLEPNTEDE